MIVEGQGMAACPSCCGTGAILKGMEDAIRAITNAFRLTSATALAICRAGTGCRNCILLSAGQDIRPNGHDAAEIAIKGSDNSGDVCLFTSSQFGNDCGVINRTRAFGLTFIDPASSRSRLLNTTQHGMTSGFAFQQTRFNGTGTTRLPVRFTKTLSGRMADIFTSSRLGDDCAITIRLALDHAFQEVGVADRFPFVEIEGSTIVIGFAFWTGFILEEGIHHQGADIQGACR